MRVQAELRALTVYRHIAAVNAAAWRRCRGRLKRLRIRKRYVQRVNAVLTDAAREAERSEIVRSNRRHESGRSLSVEASGHFNVQSYMGLEDKPGSGYDQISYKVTVDAPDATPEQIAYLIERCEQSSPVGDTLARNVAMHLRVLMGLA